MPSKNLEDFGYILSEIDRIAIGRLEKRQDVFSSPMEYFYSLPKNEGLGFISIGKKAEDKFNTIARRVHASDPRLAAKSNVSVLCKTIKHIFQEEILGKKNKLSQALADKIVSRAVKHVMTKKLTTITYFWPCVLLDDSEAHQFCLGPVIFTRTTQFLDQKKKLLKRYTRHVESEWIAKEIDSNAKLKASELGKKKKEIQKTSKTFEKDLREHYQQYPWIAAIEVSDFEEEKSKEIANLCINTALNILRLFSPWQHAGDIRHDQARRYETRTPSLTEINGVLDISNGFRWEQRNEKGWVQKITSGKIGSWLVTAASLIPYLISGEAVPILYQRYINALWWYGEALAQEDVPYLKIISLSNALEAFLGTTEGDRKKSISSQISKRAAFLLTLHDGKEDWVRRVKQFYKVRSDLVHGRTPAFESSVKNQIGWGTRIVSQTLMQGLSWTLFLAKHPRPETVKEIHTRFERDLPQYASGDFFKKQNSLI